MTEQEIVEMLDDIWTYGHEPTDKQREAVRNAMDALEELQQYRTIGTVEEIKRMKTYASLARKHGTIGQAIDSCVEYEAIGTVQECREAREKQRAMKPVMASPYRTISYYKCPICDEILDINKGFCCDCGQALDWSE